MCSQNTLKGANKKLNVIYRNGGKFDETTYYKGLEDLKGCYKVKSLKMK